VSILVQKFGGTSVGTLERIRHVATIALSEYQKGRNVAVVVSAMAKETDRLLELARCFSPSVKNAEADVLASSGETMSAALTALAIQSLGGKARSFLGFQLPVLTDDNSAGARILSIDPGPLFQCFREGVIPVIAGFQGIDKQGRITTLGRGGSDTTAVAIAAALGSVPCHIYTDVDGVYSADPKICNDAVLFPDVSYRFMLEAAGLGAKVMHDRSVSMGMRYQVPITVKSSFTRSQGTEISCREVPVNCVTLDRSATRLNELRAGRFLFADEEVAKVSLVGPLAQDFAERVPSLLTLLGKQGISCCGIRAGMLSLSFSVPEKKAKDAVQILHSQCLSAPKEVVYAH
jgi:aspartate kinase